MLIAQAASVGRAAAAFLTSRPGSFVVLAVLLSIQNTYASTLVASVFLARVGAQGMPFYYVLFAATVIPFSALFTTIIDRVPRPVLFRNMLGLFTIVAIIVALLLYVGGLWCYVAFLAVRVFEHLIVSIYYILSADYFTVTDTKRYAGRVALGMAVGGCTGGALLTAVIAGGGLIAAASVTPGLVAVVLAFGGWVTARHSPLDAAPPAARERLIDSLQILPPLVRRYPLIALMAAAMFLNILLQCVAEFLAFSIYSIHFPQVDRLSAFLGLVNAGLSVTSFLIIVAFTDRQLPRLGVPKMNRVYPALDLLTFGVLTVSQSLPAGILANMSYDPFERGIDVPVATLNYNAIRFRFVGRVRLFIDGMIFPLGLASAGTLLMVSHGRLDLRAIAACGLLLSAILFVLHWNIGRYYARGLVEMLQDGAVELDQVERGLRIPAEQVEEIRAMLAGDPRAALMGLEMAARCESDVPAVEIGGALAKIPTAQARAVLTQFAASERQTRRSILERLAEAGPPGIRQLSFERLFCTEDRGIADRARALLADDDAGVRCVAAARVLIDDPTDQAALTVLTGPLAPETALGAVAVFRNAGARGLSSILAGIAMHSDPAVRTAAVEAAYPDAQIDAGVREWIRRASGDPQPMVRGAAISVLTRLATAEQLGATAAKGLGDPSPDVRRAAAQALGARGETAAAAICGQLQSDREDVQVAAIEALGLARGTAASDLLFHSLSEGRFATIAANQRLGRSFPRDHSAWPAVHAALDNARRRTVRVVMHALDTLGHRHTLNLVRLMMTSGDERSRANAIESLASLPQRRFVIPLLPLIDGRETAGAPPRSDRVDAAPLIREAMASSDPWLRAAAAVAWHGETGKVSETALRDPSTVVAETARQLVQRPAGTCPYAQESIMSRLAFLHDLPLFADTSLDDLIAVDHALASETYLADEAIVTEGERGDRLCIIYRGEVVVHKGGRILARLAAGDFFGEMSLFDHAPRSATVTAAGEVEVLMLQSDRFHTLVQQRSGILMELCTTLVRRLRAAEQEPAAQPLSAAG